MRLSQSVGVGWKGFCSKRITLYFSISISFSAYSCDLPSFTGIKITGVVRCDQPRVLDLGARNARKVDTLPLSIMDEVLVRFAPIFE